MLITVHANVKQTCKTYSSLSLRLRLPFRLAEIVPGGPPSLLLSSIARLSCSSSYAASRLFIVERRPFDVLSALAIDFLPSLDFFEFSFEGAGEDCGDFDCCMGR